MVLKCSCVECHANQEGYCIVEDLFPDHDFTYEDCKAKHDCGKLIDASDALSEVE